MKTTLNEYSFVNEFQEFQNRIDLQNFSRNGLFALYDCLIEYEEQTGEEQEFDPIAICCNFSEYPTAWDAMLEYSPDDMPTIDTEGLGLVEIQEEQEKEALKWLEERTIVLVFEGGIIIQNF